MNDFSRTNLSVFQPCLQLVKPWTGTLDLGLLPTSVTVLSLPVLAHLTPSGPVQFRRAVHPLIHVLSVVARGIAHPLASPSGPFLSAKVVHGCCPMGSKSATRGTPRVPAAPAVSVSTSAHCAATTTPCLSTPVSPIEAILPIRTPLKWQAWHLALSHALLLHEFSDVPTGIREGFRLGPSTTLQRTFIQPNHKSTFSNPTAVSAHIQSELLLQRYSGPFHPDRLQSLIGPFQTSPLGVVPKSDGRFRIIQDMSFPRNASPVPSINSLINSDDFPCEWSTFAQCYQIVARAPPGSQAAVFDVDSAYRNVPVYPGDQVFGCVQFQDLIYVDHCLAFGCASSCGIFGRPADALVALYKAQSITDILKWVDDFVFFRYPTSSVLPYTYSYDASLIWSLADQLGWPWSLPKHQPFSPSFTYLGFSWSISAKTVQLPESKKSKYLLRLKTLLTSKSATLREAQKLLGTLNHCCLVIPEGPSHLTSLFTFTSAFKHSASPFIRHNFSLTLLTDLMWWDSQLHLSFCGRAIKEPPALLATRVYVDASSSWGIGILIDGHWDAFKFLPGAIADSRNIGWAEMVAVEIAIGILVDMLPNGSHVRIHSDNQGVLAALKNQRSRGVPANESLQRQCRLLLNNDFWISGEYIPSAANLADSLSRGHLSQSHTRLSHSFVIPPVLTTFIIRA